MKNTIDEKLNENKLKEKDSWADLAKWGFWSLAALYAIGMQNQENYNPLEWDFSKFRPRYVQSERNGFHYDLDSKLPKNTAKFEDFYNKEK